VLRHAAAGARPPLARGRWGPLQIMVPMVTLATRVWARCGRAAQHLRSNHSGKRVWIAAGRHWVFMIEVARLPPSLGDLFRRRLLLDWIQRFDTIYHRLQQGFPAALSALAGIPSQPGPYFRIMARGGQTTADAHDIPISLCGDMASDPALAVSRACWPLVCAGLFGRTQPCLADVKTAIAGYSERRLRKKGHSE